MAVAAPVLERKTNSPDTQEYSYEYRNAFMTADERHNSCISANYARLINPETTLKDIFKQDYAPAQKAEAYVAPAPVKEQKPYLVENARADSDIFRADSAINRKDKAEEIKDAAPTEEEENEDLRPTPTTIQYRTEGVAKTVEEGKVSNRAFKLSNLTKRDKIVIAIAVTVIVALFVLIIVNSAVLTNLNSEMNVLQSNLNVARATYYETLQAKNTYLEQQNIEQVVSQFAANNGMVAR